MRWPPSPPSCPVARAQLQHTCAAHPAEVQVWHGAPLLRAAGCFQCVSGVSTFLGILVRTRNCNGSQCADPRAHKETAMVRNQLTPKCNRSNRCSFTKPPPLVGVSQCVCSVYYQPNSSRRGGPLSRPPAGCALGSVGNPFDRVWPPTTSGDLQPIFSCVDSRGTHPLCVYVREYGTHTHVVCTWVCVG